MDLQGDFFQLLDEKKRISVKNQLISILKVSLCSSTYDDYYSINKIFESPASSLQASMKTAPEIRHAAVNNFS